MSFKGSEYDEFGQTIETGDSLFKNDVKFTGAVHDQSINIYYINVRFYNSPTGRLMNIRVKISDEIDMPHLAMDHIATYTIHKSRILTLRIT